MSIYEKSVRQGLKPELRNKNKTVFMVTYDIYF